MEGDTFLLSNLKLRHDHPSTVTLRTSAAVSFLPRCQLRAKVPEHGERFNFRCVPGVGEYFHSLVLCPLTVAITRTCYYGLVFFYVNEECFRLFERSAFGGSVSESCHSPPQVLSRAESCFQASSVSVSVPAVIPPGYQLAKGAKLSYSSLHSSCPSFIHLLTRFLLLFFTPPPSFYLLSGSKLPTATPPRRPLPCRTRVSP